MIIQIIMTESTSYLDMNKKTFVIQIKPINSLVFLEEFQAQLDRSIAFLLRRTRTSQPPKNQPLFNPLSPSPLDPKKNFPCFSSQKIFPPRPRFELTPSFYFPHSARPPRARPALRRRRFPARARPPPPLPTHHVPRW